MPDDQRERDQENDSEMKTSLLIRTEKRQLTYLGYIRKKEGLDNLGPTRYIDGTEENSV